MKTKKPIIVGLTGSIGMGKTTVTKMFARLGAPTFCADEIVRRVLSKGGSAAKPISKLYPQTLKNGAIDRKKLGSIVFSSAKETERLELILHPLVWKERERFLKQASKDKAPAVILDIPLLFETKADKMCHITICVSAGNKAQKERVLKRPGMTPQKLRAVLDLQMPDAEKKKRADIVIKTNTTLSKTRADVKKIWTFICSEGQAV